jgi:hypothetical protein
MMLLFWNERGMPRKMLKVLRVKKLTPPPIFISDYQLESGGADGRTF